MKKLEKLRRFLPFSVKQIWPIRQLNIGTLIDVPPGFYATNPSIVALDQQYVCVVRCVNYFYPSKKSLKVEFSVGNTHRTINRFVLLNKDLQLVKELEHLNSYFLDVNVEDIRLFKHEGDLLGFATLPHGEHGNQMAFIRFDARLDRAEISSIASPYNQKIEKNWSPFSHNKEICFVYSFDPIKTFRLNIAEGRCDELDLTSKPDLRLPLNYWDCGSTPGECINGEYLFLTHRRKVTLPSFNYSYANRLYSISNKTRKVASGRYFSIGHESIQFISGWHFSDDQLLVAYGRNDQKALIATFELRKFLELI